MAKKKTPKRKYKRRIRRKYISIEDARKYIKSDIAKYNSPLNDYMYNCPALNQIKNLNSIAEKVDDAREDLLMRLEVIGEQLTPSDFKQLCAHVRKKARVSAKTMAYYRMMVRKNWFATDYHILEKDRLHGDLEQVVPKQADTWRKTGKKLLDLVKKTKQKEDEIIECEDKIRDIYSEVKAGIADLEALIEDLKDELRSTKDKDERSEIKDEIAQIKSFLESIPETMGQGDVSGFYFDENSYGFEWDGETLERLRNRKENCIDAIKTYTEKQESLGTKKVWVPKMNSLKKEPRIGGRGSRVRVYGL